MSSTVPRTTAYRRQSLCVYGYLRAESNNRCFPDELKQLCLLMFAEVFDEWNMSISDDFLKLTADSNELTFKQSSHRYDRWRNAFGVLVVEKGQYVEWTFAITAQKESYDPNVFFGLIEADKCNPSSYFCDCDIEHCGVALYAYDGCAFIGEQKRKKYAVRCGKGDVVTMILDMTKPKGILKYNVNGDDQGTMVDMDINKKYRMAVSMHRNEEIIKLFRFNERPIMNNSLATETEQ